MPIFVTVLLYQKDVKDFKENIELAFVIESCLNFDTGALLQSGKMGEIYQFNRQYHTDFYRENWPQLIELINKRNISPTYLLGAVHQMETANSILINNSYIPSNDLTLAASTTEYFFQKLEFTREGCKNYIIPFSFSNY